MQPSIQQQQNQEQDTSTLSCVEVVRYCGEACCSERWHFLSSTEAEYNAVSESLRPTMQLMELLEDATQIGWKVAVDAPTIKCKVFEDNSGALEMARLPKMRPRSKHICEKMRHFREHVRSGKVTIHKVKTDKQLADIRTKPQPRPLFESQRESIMQWEAENMTEEELKQPAKHLRACEIIDEITRLESKQTHQQPK